MGLPLPLASHLRELTASIGAGDAALSDSVAALDDQLRATVPSYRGLRLTLVLGGWPVSLTSFATTDGEPPVTSLRLALWVLGRGFDPDSRITFWADRAGALADLAADLRQQHPAASAEPSERPPIALDIDLPPESAVPGLSGLAEYAAVHRAVGVLLARGDAPGQAQVSLRRAAEAAGLTVPDYAGRLLRDEAHRPGR